MKEKTTGIEALYGNGKFIKGDVTDVDLPEPKGFTNGRKILTLKQWQKRRQELLKVKLP